MKILITGGRGFVGRQVVLKLMTQGCQCVLLSRNPEKLKKMYGDVHDYFEWDALSGEPDSSVFSGVTGIINLMGEGVADKRWTTAQKEKIRQSRVLGTQNLVSGALKHAKDLAVFASASAVGYYDHFVDDTELNEESESSSGFLGQLCQDWEAAARRISESGSVRYVGIRIGIVLGDGGALKKMKLPFEFGLGAVLGSGEQWMNWIYIDDLARVFIESVMNAEFDGVYNAVSPSNLINRDFSKALGRALKRPVLFKIPAVVIKLLLGEFSTEVLRGSRVRPDRLIESGFEFAYESVESALDASFLKKIRC